MSDVDAEHQANRLLEYESSGESETIAQMMEIQGVRADKSTFPIELVMNEFKLAGRRMYAGIMRGRDNAKRERTTGPRGGDTIAGGDRGAA